TQMVALPLPPREPTLGDVDALCAASLAPDAFVDALQRAALGSRAVAHPLLQDIADGRFGDLAGAIRRLLGEYYVYSHRFTRYLAATMATLDAPEHRAALVGNSAEEAGILDDDHLDELRAAGIDP